MQIVKTAVPYKVVVMIKSANMGKLLYWNTMLPITITIITSIGLVFDS